MDALHGAFQSLVDRHPGLRTTYGVANGEPFQRVARSASVDFAAIGIASHEHWDERAAILAESRRPFDLTREFPIRVRLFHGGGAAAVLLVVQHHIAVDFWSLVLVLRHVGTAYAAEVAGAEVTVPASAFTYDYVHWLRELAASTIETRNREYWSARLARPLPAIALPGDRPQVDDSAARGASYFHELGDDAVAELVRTDGRSVFQIALTALVALLHKHSGESDIGVAVTTTNRLRAEFDEVLGDFVGSATLRVEVDGGATLADFV